MTRTSIARRTAWLRRTALAVLGLGCGVAVLAACTGGQSVIEHTTPATHSASVTPTPTRPAGSTGPTGMPVGRGTGHPTTLATPAQVTQAYATASVGTVSLWTAPSTPSRAQVLAVIQPLLTPSAYHDLAVTASPTDVFRAVAFSVPSLGRVTGISRVAVTSPSCTQAGSSARCTATTTVTLHRASGGDLHLTRSIDVQVVPAAAPGGPAWLINAIRNTDNIN